LSEKVLKEKDLLQKRQFAEFEKGIKTATIQTRMGAILNRMYGCPLTQLMSTHLRTVLEKEESIEWF